MYTMIMSYTCNWS